MKKMIATILVLAMLLTLCACGAQTDMNTATTEPTTEATTEATEPAATEPNAAEPAEDTVTCDYEDLHPLYQQLGFPNKAVKNWVSAKNATPAIVPNYPLGDWAKCVFSGHIATGNTSRYVDVYLCFFNGEIGSWLISDLGYSVAFPGYVLSCIDESYLCFTHFDCDQSKDNCCEFYIFAEVESLCVNSYAREEFYHESGFYVSDSMFYHMVEAVPSTINRKCPVSDSKCIYTGTCIRQDSKGKFSVSVDVHYFVRNSVGFNWIADSYGKALDLVGATLVSGNGCKVEFSPGPGCKTICVERTEYGYLIQ